MQKRKVDESAAWLALAMLTMIVAARCTASATEDRSPGERRLIELEAKVSMNEGLDSYPDLAMIHQTVEGHGDDARTRAAWLEQHSSCVSGRLTQDEAYRRPGNCRWTRNLMPDGRLPRGWDNALHGHWSRTRIRWLAHIERVRALVDGRDTYRPCSETPQTWDGVRYGRECVERGICPRREHPYASPRRILECDVPYSIRGEGDLHNFAVRYDHANGPS